MSGQRRPIGAYSVAMVAERWGTSDTFVYDQIKAGKLRAFKLGGKLIRVPFDAVDDYEEQAALAPANDPEPAMSLHSLGAMAVGRLVRRQHSAT